MPILILQILRENCRSDGFGHGRNGLVRDVGMLAKNGGNLLTHLQLTFVSKIGVSWKLFVFSYLQRQLTQLTQLTYICVATRVSSPYILSKGEAKCQRSESLLLILKWCTSYPGRTRTHPYGVSGCPVRGTSNNY